MVRGSFAATTHTGSASTAVIDAQHGDVPRHSCQLARAAPGSTQHGDQSDAAPGTTQAAAPAPSVTISPAPRDGQRQQTSRALRGRLDEHPRDQRCAQHEQEGGRHLLDATPQAVAVQQRRLRREERDERAQPRRLRRPARAARICRGPRQRRSTRSRAERSTPSRCRSTRDPTPSSMNPPSG